MSTVYIAPDDPKVDVIAFEGTAEETHVLEGQATTNPIENGGQITDHVLKTPNVFTCEVVITNSPAERTFEGEGISFPIALSYPPIPPNTAAFAGPPRVLPASVTGLVFPGMPDRISRAYDALQAILLTEVVSVLTSRIVYDSMVLTKIEEMMKNVYAARFKLTFSEVQFVDSAVVAAPKPKEPRAIPKANAGDQNPLKGIADAFGIGGLFQGDSLLSKTGLPSS